MHQTVGLKEFGRQEGVQGRNWGSRPSGLLMKLNLSFLYYCVFTVPKVNQDQDANFGPADSEYIMCSFIIWCHKQVILYRKLAM